MGLFDSFKKTTTKEIISPESLGADSTFSLNINEEIKPNPVKNSTPQSQNDVDSGDIAVVAINEDDATLKWVIKKENALVLQPENPAYETKIFVGTEMEDIHIRGRLMKLMKDF